MSESPLVSAPFPPQPVLCFCTAAFGSTYVDLAKLLAADLQQFAPDRPCLILTDRPDDFAGFPNVQAIQHRCRGVMSYHERRFAIQRGLQIAQSVMYLDADVRICAPIPPDLSFSPGLTARSCGPMQRHLQEQFDRPTRSIASYRKQWIIDQMAAKVRMNMTDPAIKFINEFLFVVTADQGREQAFLQQWGELAIYADTLGMHKHPTYAMALAAVKVGFPIQHSEMIGLDFFDDRIEQIRIRNGQSTPEAKASYFQAQAQIERRSRSGMQSLWQRMIQPIRLVYHRQRVRRMAAIAIDRLVDG
jgi:hypothetical protein